MNPTLIKFITKHGRGKPCTVAEMTITKAKVREVLQLVGLGIACLIGGALAAACALLAFAL